jgi:hypothetical protein
VKICQAGRDKTVEISQTGIKVRLGEIRLWRLVRLGKVRLGEIRLCRLVRLGEIRPWR